MYNTTQKKINPKTDPKTDPIIVPISVFSPYPGYLEGWLNYLQELSVRLNPIWHFLHIYSFKHDMQSY